MTFNNLLDLTQGVNFIEWLMIVNNWSGGLFCTLLIIVIIAVIYGIMRGANNSVDNCVIGASFLGLLISTIAWLITFPLPTNHMVPTWLPFLCGTILGVGLAMRVLKGVLNG
jgi:hypothetical protein